ncbi:MAG: hypothetical protein KDC95_00405 [Planctomycetes bacterium]|nr:hypothetical protein [Planctomycetota bacterium]
MGVATRFLFAFLLSLGVAGAQQLVSPPQAVGVEGDSRSALFFIASRSMQVDDNLRASNLTSVRSISLRRNAAPQGSSTPQGCEIELSMGFAVATLGTNMDNNYASGTKKIVFTKKSVMLPDWTMGTRSPADFEFTLKFDSAFVLDPKQVPLWDMKSWIYFVDTHEFDLFSKLPPWTSGELPQEFGRGCATANGVVGYELRTEADATTLAFVHEVWNGPSGAPALAFLGFQDPNLAIGLCANLRADPAIVVPLGATDGFGDVTARATMPWSASIAGVPLFAQGLCLDATQQPLRFVLTNGCRTTTPYVAGGSGPTTRFGITRIVARIPYPIVISTTPMPVLYAQ